MLKGKKDGVMIIEPGGLMTGNTYYGQMSCPSHCSQHQARFMPGEFPRMPIILNAWFQLWNTEADLWWFGQHQYSAGPIITLNGHITASGYVDILGNQVHPMVLMLFPINDAIFQDDISPIHKPEVFSLAWKTWRCTSTSSLASTITRLKYHQTTVVRFTEQGEKQTPSSTISQATRWCSSL